MLKYTYSTLTFLCLYVFYMIQSKTMTRVISGAVKYLTLFLLYNKCFLPINLPFWKKTCVMTVLQRGQGVLVGLFLANVLRHGSQKMWLQG